MLQSIAGVQAVHKGTRSLESKQELEALVAKLKVSEAVSVAKELLYAKQQSFECRDKPNKNWARLLAGTPNRLVISETTIAQDGLVQTSLEDKLDVFSIYYSSLYQCQEPEEELIKEFMDYVDTPVFSEEHKNSLDKVFTLEELEVTLSRMKLEKSPGLDGFSLGFIGLLKMNYYFGYKSFSHIVYCME